MKIIDIINGPWAITPEMLNEIRSIYAKHLRGEKINIKEIEAQTGKSLQKKEQGYEVINGAAIIPLEGVIAKKMNLFTQISGGTSSQLVERDIRNALNDSAVEKIILYIDSPGGTIDGTFELANFIYENRGKKPIIAFTDGMMLSAAYAIGAAADAVFISGDTASVGSIGVVAAHEDISKYEEKIGIKTTEIYSGKFKRVASQYAPLSEDGRKTIQDEVDYLYSIFISDVAKFRGTTPEDVFQRMSTDAKRYFTGKEAITAGLVDGVSTLDRLINDKSKMTYKTYAKEEPEIMTLAELKEKQPDIYNAILKEGQDSAVVEIEAGLVESIAKAKAEGAAAEQARIKSVRSQSITGHEILIETLMFDGVTTGEQTAVQVLAAEKTLRESKLAAFQAEGKDIKVPVVEGAEQPSGAVDPNLPVEERAKAEWDKDPALRAEFKDNFTAFLAFKKADEAGSVKILGRRK